MVPSVCNGAYCVQSSHAYSVDAKIKPSPDRNASETQTRMEAPSPRNISKHMLASYLVEKEPRLGVREEEAVEVSPSWALT